jgi:hypothetical protein
VYLSLTNFVVYDKLLFHERCAVYGKLLFHELCVVMYTLIVIVPRLAVEPNTNKGRDHLPCFKI